MRSGIVRAMFAFCVFIFGAAAGQAQAREQLQRFLDYGPGYQPQTSRMFR